MSNTKKVKLINWNAYSKRPGKKEEVQLLVYRLVISNEWS